NLRPFSTRLLTITIPAAGSKGQIKWGKLSETEQENRIKRAGAGRKDLEELFVVVRLPQPVHELQPILRSGAQNTGRVVGEDRQTKVPTGAAKHNSNFLNHILGNRE